MKHWASKVSIALVLLAVFPYGYVQYRLRSHDWTPLNVPVTLSDGTTMTTEYFPADLTGFYNVNLSFAPINVDLEECLVGDRLFVGCEKTQNGMDLDWSVLRSAPHGDVTVVEYQRYRPSTFGGAGYVGTLLGDFNAHRGEKYRVAIRVRHVAPQLRIASPHVLIEAGRIYWEQWVIFAQLTLLFSGVVGVPGIVFLIIGLRSQRRPIPEGAVPGE